MNTGWRVSICSAPVITTFFAGRGHTNAACGPRAREQGEAGLVRPGRGETLLKTGSCPCPPISYRLRPVPRRCAHAVSASHRSLLHIAAYSIQWASVSPCLCPHLHPARAAPHQHPTTTPQADLSTRCLAVHPRRPRRPFLSLCYIWLPPDRAPASPLPDWLAPTIVPKALIQ